MFQKQGYLGFVIPKRIASNESYADLRQVVCIDLPLVSAVDLAVAFEGVNADALIMISGFSFSPTILLGRRVNNTDLDLWKIRRELLENMPFYILPVNSSPKDVALLESIIEVPTDQLGKFVNITRGAECGMNHAAISLLPSYEQSGSKLPLLHHLDVDRYGLSYSGWVIDPTLIEAAKLKDIAVYQHVPKLLVRFLSADFVVTKDEVGHASTNLLYHLQSREGTSVQLGFILSLLSSKLVNQWYRTAFQTEEVKFPHVQKSHLEQVAIPRITFTTPADERARLLAEAQTRAAAWVQQPDAAATTYPTFLASPFGAWLAARLPASNQQPASSIELPASSNQSDVIHDLLASLAEAMLALNKEKQTEMRGFLAWMERHTGAKVDDLTGKTDIQGYLGDYQKGERPLAFDDLLARLRQNRRKLTADPDARAFQETLEREYNASLATLLPLKHRLAATDRLIDLIVYRLYGLTEEEVGIVEGNR